MTLENILQSKTAEIFKQQFAADLPLDSVTINITKKEHEGDYTIVVFPLIKYSKKNPEQTAEILGNQLKETTDIVATFNVIKGFLNLSLSATYWINRLKEISENNSYGTFASNKQKVVLEYCGPNTNKPLHIGHLRNMLLGFSMSEILKASGHDVTKVNIYNDRGIAICKSMVAYLRYGKGATPESTGLKGDHFVGDWYVKFGSVVKEEIEEFLKDFNRNAEDVGLFGPNIEPLLSRLKHYYLLTGLISRSVLKDEEFNDNPRKWLIHLLEKFTTDDLAQLELSSREFQLCSSCINDLRNCIQVFLSKFIFSEAVVMLTKWEANDPDTIFLWKKMNSWVYKGFQETFTVLGVDFQKDYFESETYLLGKDIIEEGIANNVYYRKQDGSVAVDLTEEKLDEKILLRADGTSLYITQDLATAQLRYDEFKMDKMIYVVANEQDYHFKVLKLALQKLGKKWADGIYHLSYALVESPTGRFKSREGKTADADDMISEVLRIAEEQTKELGKIEGFTDEQAKELYKTIGLGALKYFILRVNPYKKIIFNPEESIDFHGHTGPFIQYTHARICAIIRKAEGQTPKGLESLLGLTLAGVERELIIHLSEFENTLRAASDKYDPSEVANYVYNLAKTYNKFYHEMPVLTAATESEKQLRILLSAQTGRIIKQGMKLLGIDVPEKM